MSNKVKNLVNKNYKKQRNWKIFIFILYIISFLYLIISDLFLNSHLSKNIITFQAVMFMTAGSIRVFDDFKYAIKKLNEKIKETEEIE